jgi:hypothetical protein
MPSVFAMLKRRGWPAAHARVRECAGMSPDGTTPRLRTGRRPPHPKERCGRKMTAASARRGATGSGASKSSRSRIIRT